MRALPWLVAACLACAVPREDAPNPLYVGLTHTTSADEPKWEPGLSPNLRISAGIMRACRPHFSDAFADMPYWFKPGGLAPEDQDILLQIGQCMASGRLGTRTLRLVAAARSRDENAERDGGVPQPPLTVQRAERAQRFLLDHGVPPDRVALEKIDAPEVPGAGPIAPLDGRVAIALSGK